MFEKLAPLFIIPYDTDAVKRKFDFVKNLTIGPGKLGPDRPGDPDRTEHMFGTYWPGPQLTIILLLPLS